MVKSLVQTAGSRCTALFISLVCLAAIFLAVASPARAEDPQLQFTQVSSRTGIVDIANAGDGSGRLFLVEQRGRIFIHQDGEDLSTPFLSISSKVLFDGEQGLLSVAFAPDYRTSGYFYVWYTNSSGGMVLARFRVSEDADRADPASETLVLSVPQPFSNHNGGRLRFGPDGMLYLGLGDGGGSNDPDGNGQDGSTLLGSLIRIDVDPSHGTYAIPGDNPFATSNTIKRETWATGLRNPWRISFDSETGDLYIADVGQNTTEEVNVQPASSSGGENYGWDHMEGSNCQVGSCDPSFVLPVAEYSHDFGCSISGGEVYRGSNYPNLVGMYLYGDWCTGNVWGLRREGDSWSSSLLAGTGFNITTFGEDEEGNMYLAESRAVYLISDGEPVTGFQINSGLNDAWYNPDTDGQGLLVAVFENAVVMFVAWFTYDTERPPDDVTAFLGEPGHRWLTAQGGYSGDTAVLDIYNSSGGTFDSGTPEVTREKIGTMTIKWKNCSEGVMSYDIPSLGLTGDVPIQRVVTDNIALCEAM